MMRYLAYHYLRPEAAEDCLQDSILLTLEKWDEFRPEALEAWVYSVTRRMALSHYRRSQRTVACDPLMLEMRLSDRRPTPEARSLMQERWRGVQEAVEALPDRLRDALQNWLELGISKGPVSKKRADKPVTTKVANNLVYRAKQELKKRLCPGG